MKFLFSFIFLLVFSSSLLAYQPPATNYNYTVTGNISSTSPITIISGTIVAGGIGYLLYENSDNPKNLAVGLFLLGGYGISALPEAKERHLGSYSLGLMLAYNALIAPSKQKDEVFLLNIGMYALGRLFGELTWSDEDSNPTSSKVQALFKKDIIGDAFNTTF